MTTCPFLPRDLGLQLLVKEQVESGDIDHPAGLKTRMTTRTGTGRPESLQKIAAVETETSAADATLAAQCTVEGRGVGARAAEGETLTRRRRDEALRFREDGEGPERSRSPSRKRGGAPVEGKPKTSSRQKEAKERSLSPYSRRLMLTAAMSKGG
ncbi:MAG: hypothetical protein M1820_004817 [Bogoriella megaspora]|nr:MAG: hypothetical protein M1820_004817 [Bogoriella megaspora]